MSDFEIAVAQHVARARVLERALHDRSDWTIRSKCAASFTDRIIDEEAQKVIFIAPLWIDPDEAGEVVLELLCGEEMVSSQVVDLLAGDSIIEWEFSIPQTTTV